MREVTVATIRLLGGHPALDFANTVDCRGARPGPDVLRSFDDLRRWALRRGVIDGAEADRLALVPEGRGRRALLRATALREALFRVLKQFPAESAPLPADLDLIRRALQAGQRARTLAPSADGYAWTWDADDPDTITHRLALAAADLMTTPALARLRVCPGENCGWLFLDNSRSGRRLWCSEETCGRRNRIRRWRARQREG
jgi:predicted RNA-binding Zn ribbon-like protein